MTASRYRGSAAVWALLLAYASLYPFYPLRAPFPEAVGNFILKPRYMVLADIVWNLLAYVPLGTLACLYFRQAGDGARAIFKAIALGAGFSFTMEVAQFFIPNRVASIYDVMANTVGTMLGALAFADPVYSLVTRPLGELRERAIIPGGWGDAGLVLLMLWLISQLNPALPFFGAGNIGGGEDSDAALLQWFAVGLSICGFGLFVSSVVAGTQGSLRSTLVLLSIALWLKFAAASAMLQPHFSEEWVSMGRVLGLAGGILLFVPLRRIARPGRIYLALVMVLAGALFSKIFGAYSPVDEFLRMFRWPHGQLANFATLTRFLHEIWPFATVGFLIALFLHVRRHPEGAKISA
jgi:VanZ family protein